MGGATQSKLAFLSTTLKKKDFNKTAAKNAAEETKIDDKTQVNCHSRSQLRFPKSFPILC